MSFDFVRVKNWVLFLMNKEDLFREIEYARKSGYLAALKDCFDSFTNMHNDFTRFHRPTIDECWERIKKLETSFREENLKDHF